MGTWLVADPADDAFVDVPNAPGMQIARAISQGSETQLGGGIIRYVADARLSGWTLGFDELLHVVEGRIEIIPHEGGAPLEARAGETIVIAQGATVDCHGDAGTRLLFTLYPRHLSEGPANAWKYQTSDETADRSAS